VTKLDHKSLPLIGEIKDIFSCGQDEIEKNSLRISAE
jgi:hypothetical protein